MNAQEKIDCVLEEIHRLAPKYTGRGIYIRRNMPGGAAAGYYFDEGKKQWMFFVNTVGDRSNFFSRYEKGYYSEIEAAEALLSEVKSCCR